MQFIRSEMYTFRRLFANVYREIPKRHSCHCISNKPVGLRFYRQVFSNRTRLKLYRQPYSSTSYSSLFEDSDEHNMDSNLGHYNVRNSLHQDSDDPLTHKINECQSVDALFALLNEQFEHLRGEHASQFVLVLWDLQKSYNESYLQNLVNEDVERSPEFMLSKYLNKLHDHKDFNKLLQLLDVHYMELSVSEASCCLLYLRKIGVPPGAEVMERLLRRCEEAVQMAGAGSRPRLPLVDITRLTAAVEPKDTYRYLSIVQQIMPSVLAYLDGCNSAEEVRLLTFLLHNIFVLTVEPVLQRYKARIQHLLDTGVLTRQHYPVLLKVANFLNLPSWSWSNHLEVRGICELIAPEIPNMDPNSIIILHKVFQTYLEPACIIEPLSKRTAHFISSMLQDNRISNSLKLPHLLFCHITNSRPEKRPAYEKIMSDHIDRMFPSTIAVFYRMLRYIKTPNTQLCDQFWGKTISYLIRDQTDEYLTLRSSFKYLNFSNVAQLYRNMYFERLMLDLLMKLFDEGFVSMFPKKFSKLAAFVLAYGYSNNSIHIDDMERLVRHIEASKHQFNTGDLLLLSRGLQISSIAMSKKHTSPVIAHLFHRADNAVTEQTQAISRRGDLSLVDLNSLVKCHMFKKTNPNADITYELVKRYSTLPDRAKQLNSHSIRDVAYNLSSCGVIIPSLFEDIASYVASAKTNILGETAYKILSLFYGLGYSPTKREVFEATSEVIERDKASMTSLALLQSCCALAYFQHLPESLIKYIFSITFMERLDAEVATCYQQWLYPRRVRRQLMRLNRCACVELPQYRVPWFHHKYIQEQIATYGSKKTTFERSVLETVKVVFPKCQLRAPHHTPYGYKINILLTVDDGNTNNAETNKVAITLLENYNFCKQLDEGPSSDGTLRPVLNGPTKHRRRHLEILGYKLVEISAVTWHSMHMTEPNVKADFLRQKILECNRSNK